MNKPWLIANLEDASAELRRAIDAISSMSADDDYLARDLIAEVFIKLSFAWNARDDTGEGVEFH